MEKDTIKFKSKKEKRSIALLQMQSMNWDNQRDNQPCPSNLSRMHGFWMFSTGGSILSSDIKIRSIKALCQDTFLTCAGRWHFLCVIPVHSNSSGHCIISPAKYYGIDYIGSLISSLRWVFTTFPSLHKLVFYPQLLCKDTGCIQKLNDILTKNLLLR